MTAEDIIQACIPTLSPRPPVYFKLVKRLIREGFTWNHETAEWIKGDIRGRLCWTPSGSQAWMRHAFTNRQTRHTHDGKPEPQTQDN